jgi:hypothetical protein
MAHDNSSGQQLRPGNKALGLLDDNRLRAMLSVIEVSRHNRAAGTYLEPEGYFSST